MASIFTRPGAAAPALSRAALTALLLGLISLAGIANHELWTPDEPREAAMALAMRRSGDVIVPRLAGEPFVEKPPLAYAVSAATLAWFEPLLGPTAALRVSSALWALATLLATYMLARRLAGHRAAAWSAAALAVTPGFVHVTHWLLVDNALMFFITAGIWLLCESYLARRPGLLPLAGMAAAGAFLTKGLVGPIFIGLGWLGIMIHLFRSKQNAGIPATENPHGAPNITATRWAFWHILAALLAAFIAGAWMAGLRWHGGPELWREWFWDNHFGRFTGQARHLGHIRGPFYYIPALAVGALPWLAVWINAAWSVCRQRTRPSRPAPTAAWPVVLTWGLGGLILLSLSSTKREIYLSTLWPCLAVLTGMLLQTPPYGWVRLCLQAWQWLALATLPVAAVVPAAAFAAGYLPGSAALAHTLLSLPVLAAAGLMWRRPGWHWPFRWLVITALAYILALTNIPPALDHFKNQGPVFLKLAAAIPPEARDRVGAWKFDETTRAGFYYYCNLVFPPVYDNFELSLILSGKHPGLDGIAAAGRNFPPEGLELPAWSVQARVKPNARGRKRELWYVTRAESLKKADVRHSETNRP